MLDEVGGYPAGEGELPTPSAFLPYKRVASRLCIADKLCTAYDTTAVLNATGERDGLDRAVYYVCRVDLNRAEQVGSATAFGMAVSWLAEALAGHETVMVCGPPARRIVEAYLERAGFSEEEASTLVGEAA